MFRVMHDTLNEPAADDGRAAPDPTPPFNSQSFLREWADSPEFVARILSGFVRETGRDLERLAEALGDGDAGRVAGCAHRLKGAAATLEAEALRAEAECLEFLGRAGALDEAALSLQRLRVEFGRFRDYVSGLGLPGVA